MSHESQGTATANDAGIDAANESWKFFFLCFKDLFLMWRCYPLARSKR